MKKELRSEKQGSRNAKTSEKINEVKFCEKKVEQHFLLYNYATNITTM